MNRQGTFSEDFSLNSAARWLVIPRLTLIVVVVVLATATDFQTALVDSSNDSPTNLPPESRYLVAALDCLWDQKDNDGCKVQVLQVHNMIERMLLEPASMIESVLSDDPDGSETTRYFTTLCHSPDLSDKKDTSSMGCLRQLQDKMIYMYDAFNTSHRDTAASSDSDDDEDSDGTKRSSPQKRVEDVYIPWANTTMLPPTSECSTGSLTGSGAAAAVGMVGLLSDFMCLQNEESQSCPFAIAEALHWGNLEGVLGGGKFSIFDMPNVCRAFKGAGCCTQAFFSVLRAMYQYACQEMSHSLETAIKSVTTDCQLPVQFGGIGEKFPSPCEGFPSMDYSAYDPATCPADSHGFWHDIKDTCGYGQYLVCPNSMCGLGCMSQAVLDDISPKVDEKKHRSPAQQAFEDKHGHFTINIPTNAIIPLVGLVALVLFVVGFHKEIIKYGSGGGGQGNAAAKSSYSSYGSLSMACVEMLDHAHPDNAAVAPSHPKTDKKQKEASLRDDQSAEATTPLLTSTDDTKAVEVLDEPALSPNAQKGVDAQTIPSSADAKQPDENDASVAVVSGLMTWGPSLPDGWEPFPDQVFPEEEYMPL